MPLAVTRLEPRDCPSGIPGWPGPVTQAGPFAGAGPGGGPRVRTETGLDFFAFEPGFRGGVRLAAADLTGDGVPDVVAVPGPGGGPVAAAFDGSTGRELWRTLAFEPAFRGGLGVAATAEAVVVTPAAGGGPVYARLDAAGRLLDTTLVGDAADRGGLAVGRADAFTVTLNGVRLDPNPLFPAGGLRAGGGAGYALPGDPPGPAVSSGRPDPVVAGTLTGYVRDAAGTLYGLSNDHVLAGTPFYVLVGDPGATVYRTGGPAVGVTAARGPQGAVRTSDSALYLDADHLPDLGHTFAAAESGRLARLAIAAAPRDLPAAAGEPVYVWTRFGVVRAAVESVAFTAGLAAQIGGVQVTLPDQLTLAPGPDGDSPAVPGYSGSLVTDRLGRPLAQLWGGAVDAGRAVVTPIRTVLRDAAAALGRSVTWAGV